MDKFIAQQNVAHCIDQLKTETDPTKRTTLKKILAEEEAKLANIDKKTKKLQQ
jgi:bacterioferritin (cytochrome b1)